MIWDDLEWRYDIEKYRKGGSIKVKTPVIPRNREFYKHLRDKLMKYNPFATNWVDGVINDAYSILRSWRRRYLKGKARKRKPVIRRRFARVKSNMMKVNYDKKIIRITLKPYEYLEISYANQWFTKRIEGWRVGEVVLKDDRVLIPFKKPIDFNQEKKRIGWDLNLLSLDGYDGENHIKIDLKELYTLHVTYENIRRRLQKLMERNPKKARKLLRKYSRRHRNRVRDYLNKLTTKLAREYRDYEHGFEDLSKKGMYNNSRKHNREISQQNWKQIIKMMNYKASVKLVNPVNTSRICSRCGGDMKPIGKGLMKCKKCGLVIDRQLNAARNIYKRM